MKRNEELIEQMALVGFYYRILDYLDQQSCLHTPALEDRNIAQALLAQAYGYC
jgi:hypothetical protein